MTNPNCTTVLNRPPVIWDNEHANDYDQKRMYLGPYSNRSPEIIPKLRGVMTNPNCEYGANFVAIHSLAAWSSCTVDGCSSLSPHDPMSAEYDLFSLNFHCLDYIIYTNFSLDK